MLTDSEREGLQSRLDDIHAELKSMDLPREERQRYLLSERHRLEATLEADDQERENQGIPHSDLWRDESQ